MKLVNYKVNLVVKGKPQVYGQTRSKFPEKFDILSLEFDLQDISKIPSQTNSNHAKNPKVNASKRPKTESQRNKQKCLPSLCTCETISIISELSEPSKRNCDV